MEYTIEQFEIDYENSSPLKKEELLIKILDSPSIKNEDGELKPEVMDVLREHREDLIDLKLSLDIENDIRFTKDIESGKASLYKCVKSPLDKIKIGQSYYILIDDVSSELLSKWISEIPDDAKEIPVDKPL